MTPTSDDTNNNDTDNDDTDTYSTKKDDIVNSYNDSDNDVCMYVCIFIRINTKVMYNE